MFTRRRFSQLALLSTAGLATSQRVFATPPADDSMSYMDGCHGGIIGHMPPGSWRDILSALDEFPDWKISLDIEPDSWEALRRSDPESFARLADLLRTGDRVEMVGATYAQPYGWAVSGESNIRQLQIGLRIIRQAFPAVRVTTYAVQEPCWASCLPQILRSLGMNAASLKNASTAWGGYSAGFNADVVRWIGPDGSHVSAVPRYAMERVQQVWETESIDALPEFARRCREAGIEHPAGMCFQDLGWSAKPRVQRTHLTYRTWREYFNFAGEPKKEWRFTPEDILVTLPWGDSTLRTVAQQVRRAEVLVASAERFATLATLQTRVPYPAEVLEQAWKRTLLAQAHDAWITATTRTGREAWAFTVAQNTLDAENAANEIVVSSMEAVAQRATPSAERHAEQVLVFNGMGTPRTDLVSLSVTADRGTKGFTLHDAQGRSVPIQVLADRTYLPVQALKELSAHHQVDSGAPEKSTEIAHAVVLARVDVPALGYAAFTVAPQARVADGDVPYGATVQESPATVTVQTDLYRAVFDKARGGVLSSLIALHEGKELATVQDGRHCGEVRGYFIEQAAWLSTVDQPATIHVREQGPLRVVLDNVVPLAGGTVTTQITFVQGEPRIDVSVAMDFPNPTWVGAPVNVQPKEVRTQRKRSQNDGRWKLQVHYPFGSGGELYKSAACDVCRSRVADTSFEGWDEIRHNIIAQWVDLWQPAQAWGLAVFTDCTTAYNYGPEQPLGLVLAWAWEGGFWWGKHALQGRQVQHFALLPHHALWDRANLWREYERFSDPLRSALSTAPASLPLPALSLVDTQDPGLQVSALEMRDGAVFLRVFQSGSERTHHTIKLGFRPVSVERVELNDSVVGDVAMNSVEQGVHFSFDLHRFGLATFRFRMA